MVALLTELKSKTNDGLSVFQCSICCHRIGANTSSAFTCCDVRSLECQNRSVMCGVCFVDYQHTTHLAATEKISLLYTCSQTHSELVDELTSSSASVVSVQASSSECVVVEGAANLAECVTVKTAEQIEADDAARLDAAMDAHDVEKGLIQGTFSTVLAFVQTIDKGCTRPVTREDVFKAQRWHIQAVDRDRQRREDAADEAADAAAEAAEAAADAADEKASDEDEGEDEDEISSSSDEEEEDKCVAKEGQLTSQAKVA
jgi:hypothetical protein